MIDSVIRKNISDLIYQGNAFVNPINDHILAVKGSVADYVPSDILDQIQLLEDTFIIDEVNRVLLDNLTDKVALLDTAMNRMKAHTDVLSGVVLNAQKNIYNIMQIVNAAQDDLVTCTLKEFGVDSNPFSKIDPNNPFGLTYGTFLVSDKLFQLANTATGKIENLKSFLTNITDFTTTPEQKKQAIEDILVDAADSHEMCSQSVESQITDDELAYEDALKKVLAKTITENLVALANDSCSGQLLNKFFGDKIVSEINKIVG